MAHERGNRSGCLRRTIVAGVETGIIEGAINLDPVCSVDAATVAAGRTEWKCASDLNPAILLLYDLTDFVSDFGKVLVLAEDQRHVVNFAIRQRDNIQRQPD